MNNISLSILDKLLASDLPVVTMPHDTMSFAPLAVDGHRLVLAGNGLFKEIRRPWIYVRYLLEDLQTPFGMCTPVCETIFHIPKILFRQFLGQAKTEAPLETAAWITWNQTSAEFMYNELVAPVANYSRLTVNRPPLPSDEHLIVDLHSHHCMAAEFSGIDDADDRMAGYITFAGVVGTIDTKPTWNFRLCLEGHLLPVDMRNFISNEQHDQ